MGGCCCREEDDFEAQLMELKDEVEMWRAQAAGLDSEKEALTAEKETLAALKKRGSVEKMELRHQVEMLRAQAAGLGSEKETLASEKETLAAEKESLAAEKESLAALKRRGSAERMELRLQAAELTAKLEALAEKYAHSLTCRMRGSVEQASLRRKASALGHENERSARGTAFAIETLGPLQSHIKEGDAPGLQDLITTLTPRMAKLEDDDGGRELGELAGIVRALYNDAVVKACSWREVLATMRAVVETMEAGKVSRRDAKRLFGAVKEGCITGLSVHKSDAELTGKLEEAFLSFYIGDGAYGNRVQREIVHRVCQCSTLHHLDFTDMSQCVSLVDLAETPNNEFFLSRAEAVIDGHEVAEFRHILTSLDTIIFFLRFLDQEDLALTYTVYRDLQSEAWLLHFLRAAEAEYGPGRELVRTAGLDLRSEEHVKGILEQLRSSPPGASTAMQGLRSIFFSWAQIMKEKFDILVLPHHTQVVCMLICLQYIAGPSPQEMGALIAEMGTGEGKSAVIASLALYCVVFLGQRVHVVVDDESLVERDFQTYRSLFSAFQSRRGLPVQARLCVSASKKRGRFARDDAAAVRVDEDADIVYCEARHVQSFYTQLAKRGGVDFDMVYRHRVLILDEVDALVIGEAPNVPFVYENQELSAFATRVAEGFVRHLPPEQIAALATSSAEKKVLRNMEKAAQTVSKWVMHADYILDQDTSKYVRVQDGRSNDGAWSLALEYKNYADHLSDRVVYNERLFVMSRPRVFCKYNRIVGLSGSVGNDAERAYLSTVYRARFFKVPKFLATCRGAAACNVAEPRGVIIEEDEDAQWRTTCERAFACRESTPVLIIARDRQAATRLAQELHCQANAKGLSGKDIVCSLSRDLCESQPELFKENLFRCTQPMGKGASKAFRIAVTDPRGGRGVDYRVSDPDADRAGGLMLIVNHIPKCSRDWTQYLGRTARQDRRGQWLAVLSRRDYAEDERRSGKALEPRTAVEVILGWGSTDTRARLQEVHGQYHRGVRMNELSEEVVRRGLLDYQRGREVMVRLCGEYGRMSLAQIDALAAEIPGLQPSAIRTAATEVGAEANAPASLCLSRSIIFLIDRSSSMLSQDAGGKTRFEVCRGCILDIFEKQLDDHDHLGLYTFETEVRESFPLTQKGVNHKRIAAAIHDLPAPHGLTRMFDGLAECLLRLQQSGSGPKFLVTLTDGDDNQSTKQPNGEKVTALLRAGIPGLSLIFVTCGGDLKPRTLELVRYWAQLAKSSGQIGAHISARNPAQLREAFATVAELIDEPEGEVEI